MNLKESVAIGALINAYETHGHLLAHVDPLNLQHVYKDMATFSHKLRMPTHEILEFLNPAAYGLTEEDLDREFNVSIQHKSSIILQ
jgi:2-oxoglutarate dehydrogenase complex dehydrogenase (E1) component-like enzyme